MNIYCQDNVAALLLASELNYFRSGVRVVRVLNGELLHANGFESLASGVVLHGVSGGSLSGNLNSWLSELEACFDMLGASAYRLYTTSDISENTSSLCDRGYRRSTEIGLSMSLANKVDRPAEIAQSIGLVWQEIHDGSQRAARKALYQEAEVGPDGYSMQDGRFADFETMKQDAGYMTSYLLYKRQVPVGCVSLSVQNQFGRLKNLLVHPEQRGLGYGRLLVNLLKCEAVARGAKYLGAYALENKPGYRTYTSCGMRQVLSQVEYYKPAG